MSENLKEIIKWVNAYKIQNNCKGVVVYLSGDKNSTTVAMISKKVFGDNILAVIMPNSIQPNIDYPIEIAKQLGIKTITPNIEDTFMTLLTDIETADEKIKIPIKVKPNITSRIRMTVIYAIAKTLGYYVIGTSNKSDNYIGLSTKFGDQACDFNPILHLTKTKVSEIFFELAEEFNLLSKYIVETKSDGLISISDDKNLGFTYEQLDEYIDDPMNNKVPKSIQYLIENMHLKSIHKRRMPSSMDIHSMIEDISYD